MLTVLHKCQPDVGHFVLNAPSRMSETCTKPQESLDELTEPRSSAAFHLDFEADPRCGPALGFATEETDPWSLLDQVQPNQLLPDPVTNHGDTSIAKVKYLNYFKKVQLSPLNNSNIISS